ncbi:arylesterase [Floridanema aerugineum]|uniref:Arylesterase n=1 Tax=Floridaenema aerugineum BLCC-F46 TaxID=3153654 RepID=A0ABV4XFV8_9CYAN
MKKYRWLNFFILMLCSLLVFTSCSNYIDSVKNLKAGAGKQVIVLGDSIASGYGVEEKEAFPSVLSQELGLPIINRGVSGDTTDMGLKRLQTDVIAAEPWLVIVELGGNDFLRKFPKSETEKNLRQIVTSIQEKSAIVVLLGMNLGLFTDEYKTLYQRVAKETNAYLIPESLKGILDNPRYRQEDFIHPNVEGHKLLATRVATELKPLLAKASWPSALMQFRPIKK